MAVIAVWQSIGFFHVHIIYVIIITVCSLSDVVITTICHRGLIHGHNDLNGNVMVMFLVNG